MHVHKFMQLKKNQIEKEVVCHCKENRRERERERRERERDPCDLLSKLITEG